MNLVYQQVLQEALDMLEVLLAQNEKQQVSDWLADYPGSTAQRTTTAGY